MNAAKRQAVQAQLDDQTLGSQPTFTMVKSMDASAKALVAETTANVDEEALLAKNEEAGPPVVGPPFTPLLDVPSEVGLDDTDVVEPGTGRDYSAP